MLEELFGGSYHSKQIIDNNDPLCKILVLDRINSRSSYVVTRFKKASVLKNSPAASAYNLVVASSQRVTSYPSDTNWQTTTCMKSRHNELQSMRKKGRKRVMHHAPCILGSAGSD